MRPAAEKSTYPARIEQRLGGRPQFERFSGQILDWTDSAMSRAYALRRLAQQFPRERRKRDGRRETAARSANWACEHLAAFARKRTRRKYRPR